MNMMRHCRQCRADAVGLLGEDRSEEFTTDKIMAMEVDYDIDCRKAYQAPSRRSARPRWRRKEEELETLAGESSDVKILIAVATKGWGLVNEHFGHAKEFQIYELWTAVRSSSATAASTSIARAASATRTAWRR